MRVFSKLIEDKLPVFFEEYHSEIFFYMIPTNLVHSNAKMSAFSFFSLNNFHLFNNNRADISRS